MHAETAGAGVMEADLDAHGKHTLPRAIDMYIYKTCMYAAGVDIDLA
jgi:hypothetical protein